MKHKYT